MVRCLDSSLAVPLPCDRFPEGLSTLPSVDSLEILFLRVSEDANLERYSASTLVSFVGSRPCSFLGKALACSGIKR